MLIQKIEYLLTKKKSKIIFSRAFTRYDIETIVNTNSSNIDEFLRLSDNVVVEFYYENNDYVDYEFTVFLNVKYNVNCNVSNYNLCDLVNIKSINVKPVYSDDESILNVENKIEKFQQMLNINRTNANLEIQHCEAKNIINTIIEIFNDNTVNTDIQYFIFSFINLM